RQQLAVARLVDADLAQHLANDDLDVLVVDGHALASVDLLDLLDQVALDRVAAAGIEELLRVDRPIRDRVARADLLALGHEQPGVVRDGVLALDDVLGPDDEPVIRLVEEARDRGDHVLAAVDAGDRLAERDRIAGRREELRLLGDVQRRVVALPAGDLDLRPGVGTNDRDQAVDVADLGLALGNAGLEQLLDTGQAGRDVEARHTAGVEGPHRQLRARLADGLGGDDAHRLAHADRLAGGEVAAVAPAAHAVARLAGERR